MKPYGYKRKDLTTCKYGCCGTKYNKHRNCRKKSDQMRRKTARQQVRSILSPSHPRLEIA